MKKGLPSRRTFRKPTVNFVLSAARCILYDSPRCGDVAAFCVVPGTICVCDAGPPHAANKAPAVAKLTAQRLKLITIKITAPFSEVNGLIMYARRKAKRTASVFRRGRKHPGAHTFRPTARVCHNEEPGPP